jgi:hypothetical protein
MTTKTLMQLSATEAKILSVSAQIGFGELIEVDTSAGPHDFDWDVTPSQRKFIEQVRNLNHVTRIIVHNSEPVSMEVEGQIDHITYIRKIKI